MLFLKRSLSIWCKQESLNRNMSEGKFYGLAMLEYAERRGFKCDHDYNEDSSQTLKYVLTKKPDRSRNPVMCNTCSLCGKIILYDPDDKKMVNLLDLKVKEK